MLSVLIEGTLIAAPVQRTSAKGTPFVTVQVRCSGDDGQSVLCSVIAFQASVAEALAALAAGDTVAVAGPAALSQWEKNGEHRIGLKVTAARVLSVYEAGMRRKAASQEREPGTAERPFRLLPCLRTADQADVPNRPDARRVWSTWTTTTRGKRILIGTPDAGCHAALPGGQKELWGIRNERCCSRPARRTRTCPQIDTLNLRTVVDADRY